MVLPGSGTNEVDVADGQGDDRVVCMPGSTNRIQADRADRVSGCRSSSGYRAAPSPAPRAHSAQSSGNGTDATPFIQPCQRPPEPGLHHPRVHILAQRSLDPHGPPRPTNGPAPDHPWLYSHVYVPLGTKVPYGVEVDGLGAVGIFIAQDSGDGDGWATGTKTDGASVTNWTTGTNTYSIALHCTSTTNDGWLADNYPF